MKNRVVVLSLLCLLFSIGVIAQSPTNSEEQYQLGMKYYNGDGVKKNYKEAAKLFKMAAEQNHTLSQIALGMLYMTGGKGIKKDISSAELWFDKAANQGNALAQDYMGVIYEVEHKDPITAISYYKKAANQGNEHSKEALKRIPTNRVEQYSLGMKYYNGDGIKQDSKRTLYWMTQSANQNYDLAQCFLGAIYLGGNGIKRDISKSEYWARKAAEQGNPIAQDMMGFIYDVWKNNKYVAVQWYKKAAANGNEHSQVRLSELGVY